MRNSSVNKIFALIVITVLSVLTAGVVIPVSTALADGAAVDLVLVPGSPTIEAGQSFSIDIQVQCNDQPVDGVQAYVDFNPEFIEVQSILPGNALDTVLQSDYDNKLGTLDFSAGKMTPPFPSATFILATIIFKTKINISNTAITLSFHLAEPRDTFVDYGGINVLRNTINVLIDVYAPVPPSPEPTTSTTTITTTVTTNSPDSASSTTTDYLTPSGTASSTLIPSSSTAPAPTSTMPTLPATTTPSKPAASATATVSPPALSATKSNSTSASATAATPAASTNWRLVGDIIGGLAALIVVLLILWKAFKKRPGQKT